MGQKRSHLSNDPKIPTAVVIHCFKKEEKMCIGSLTFLLSTALANRFLCHVIHEFLVLFPPDFKELL